MTPRLLWATAVASATVSMATQALDISVSGHVNRAIRFADNGTFSDVQHLEPTASRSRFHFTVPEEGNSATTGSVHNDSLLYFSGDFGEVTLGNAPAADNGVMWTNHNGAWMGIDYSPDTNSSLDVMVVNSMSSGYSVFSFFPSVNIGRKNTLRYDTPSIVPVSFSTRVQKNGATDHMWSFAGDTDTWPFRCPPPPPPCCCYRCPNPKPGPFVAWPYLIEDYLNARPKGMNQFMDGSGGIAGDLVFVSDPRFSATRGPDGPDRETDDGPPIDPLHFVQRTIVDAAWRPLDDSGKDYEDLYVSTETGADMEARAIGLGTRYTTGGRVDVYAGFDSYSLDAPGKQLEDINAFHVGSLVSFPG